MGGAGSTPHAAGIVLAGGRSVRMGSAKAGLPWRGSTLLARTCDVLGAAGVQPVVVVRAPAQPLPPVDPAVRLVEDPREGLGPLQGLAAGLAAVADEVEVAFVCATDLPFLHPAYVRRVLAACTPDADVVLPVCAGRPQPLTAAYRTVLAPAAQRRVEAGRLALLDFVGGCRVVHLDEAALLADPALAAADPALRSVVNVNDPEEFDAAARGDVTR